MSAGPTVVVSSAEGAGDMPSSAPVGGGDTCQDGAQPFSEVLSLSSPDHPSSSGSAPPPGPPQSLDDAHDDNGTTGATLQGQPAAAPPGSGRPQRRAGTTSEQGDKSARRAVDSPPGPDAAPGDQPPLPGTSQAQAGAAAIDPDLGATHLLATTATVATAPTAATSAAPGQPSPPNTAVASIASDGLSARAFPTEAAGGDDVTQTPAATQDGSGPQTVASVAASLPQTFGVASTTDGAGRNPALAAVAGEGGDETREVSGRGTAPGSNALHSGPVRIVANGTTSGAPASAFSVATTGTSGTAAVSTEEILEPAEFPDTGGGGAAVDISDLAASISRPLAEGSGDYSVQVSLHPPELGQVRALLSLQGDVLHVTLNPEHAGGFDALSDAMPSLQEQLAGGGIEVHVTLGQPGSHGDGNGGGERADARPAGSAPSDEAASIVSVPSIPLSGGGPGRIHLVL